MKKVYERLDLEQGTQAWLEARQTRATTSQISAILGISPYQTALELFEEKVLGKELHIDNQKRRLFNLGHESEKSAREWLESHFGIQFTPAVLVSTRCSDLLSSLDGFNEDENLIFEAKFMGKDALNDVKQGKIKPDHECQVQGELYVSGADRCIYFARDPSGEAAIKEIKPNLQYQEEIAEAAMRFMKRVRERSAPEPSQRDFFITDDPRFEQLRCLKLQSDQAELAFKNLKEQLVKEYEKHNRIKAAGLIIQKIMAKGTVDYTSIPELQGVDLEQYRKKSYPRVDVRLEKGKDSK